MSKLGEKYNVQNRFDCNFGAVRTHTGEGYFAFPRVLQTDLDAGATARAGVNCPFIVDVAPVSCMGRLYSGQPVKRPGRGSRAAARWRAEPRQPPFGGFCISRSGDVLGEGTLLNRPRLLLGAAARRGWEGREEPVSASWLLVARGSPSAR